jgi:hypothetical protein
MTPGTRAPASPRSPGCGRRPAPRMSCWCCWTTWASAPPALSGGRCTPRRPSGWPPAAPVAETLRLNGYATAHIGKCHEVPAWEMVASRIVIDFRVSDLRESITVPDQAIYQRALLPIDKLTCHVILPTRFRAPTAGTSTLVLAPRILEGRVWEPYSSAQLTCCVRESSRSSPGTITPASPSTGHFVPSWTPIGTSRSCCRISSSLRFRRRVCRTPRTRPEPAPQRLGGTGRHGRDQHCQELDRRCWCHRCRQLCDPAPGAPWKAARPH